MEPILASHRGSLLCKKSILLKKILFFFQGNDAFVGHQTANQWLLRRCAGVLWDAATTDKEKLDRLAHIVDTRKRSDAHLHHLELKEVMESSVMRNAHSRGNSNTLTVPMT